MTCTGATGWNRLSDDAMDVAAPTEGSPPGPMNAHHGYWFERTHHCQRPVRRWRTHAPSRAKLAIMSTLAIIPGSSCRVSDVTFGLTAIGTPEVGD